MRMLASVAPEMVADGDMEKQCDMECLGTRLTQFHNHLECADMMPRPSLATRPLSDDPPAGAEITERVDWTFTRYANCWEDADVLRGALCPAEGRRILSIASAGDNALALVGSGADVIAADINPAQLACLELRVAAFRCLTYEQLLQFLGVTRCPDRLALFANLEGELSDAARSYWRQHSAVIANGAIHGGRLERYFQRFRRWVLPLAHRQSTVRELFASDRPSDFFDRRWNTRRWRTLFPLYFSRVLLGRLGRDREFFRHVTGTVGQRLLDRAEWAMTRPTVGSNPFLRYMFTGNFGRSLPTYLRPEMYSPIRANLDRLNLYHGSIDEAARAFGGTFDGFNLSNIFEYLSPALTTDLYGRLLEHARPGARFAYWNLFVDRSCPRELRGRVVPRTTLASELRRHDHGFFYGAFHVEECV